MGSVFRSILGAFTSGGSQPDSPPTPSDVSFHVPGMT